MTSIPCSTSYDLWKTAAPEPGADDTFTLECDNYIDEDVDEPVLCGYKGPVEVEVWTIGRYEIEYAGTCPKCGHEIRGEDDFCDGPED